MKKTTISILMFLISLHANAEITIKPVSTSTINGIEVQFTDNDILDFDIIKNTISRHPGTLNELGIQFNCPNKNNCSFVVDTNGPLAVNSSLGSADESFVLTLGNTRGLRDYYLVSDMIKEITNDNANPVKVALMYETSESVSDHLNIGVTTSYKRRGVTYQPAVQSKNGNLTCTVSSPGSSIPFCAINATGLKGNLDQFKRSNGQTLPKLNTYYVLAEDFGNIECSSVNSTSSFIEIKSGEDKKIGYF